MSKRIDDIEILRAIAIIYVLIEHLPINLFVWSTPALVKFYDWFGGASGVDLFFCVSGFLITRELEPKLRGASSRREFFNLTVGFWLRRFWRLIPSAWLWLAIGLIACAAFNQSGAFASFNTNLNGAIASTLQLQNIYLPTIVGQEMPNNFLYWSLSLEEQFYLLPCCTVGRHTLVRTLLYPYSGLSADAGNMVAPVRTRPSVRPRLWSAFRCYGVGVDCRIERVEFPSDRNTTASARKKNRHAL